MFAGVPYTEDKIKKIDEAFEFLNTFLAGNEYVAGNQLTLADVSILASVTTIQVSHQSRVISYLNFTHTAYHRYAIPYVYVFLRNILVRVSAYPARGTIPAIMGTVFHTPRLATPHTHTTTFRFPMPTK